VEEREQRQSDEESAEREHHNTGEADVEAHQLQTDAPGVNSREEPQQNSRE
jgi:hypothetical protein